MESRRDVSGDQPEWNPRLSRRSMLRWSAAGAFAAAGLLTGCASQERAATLNMPPSAATSTPTPKAKVHRSPTVKAQPSASYGPLLFEDTFEGSSLNRQVWNPYICDNNSNGWPWFTNSAVEVASSAISGPHGRNASFNLPSAIDVNGGLTLRAYRGTRAAGYAWTGSVVCSRPTSNNLGQGTVYTTGFTFADARVEVRAKMPDLTGGQWPSIWFLPAPGSSGGEIDLFEGGLLTHVNNPNQLMAVNLFTKGNLHHLVDCGTDLSAGYHTYAMEYRQGESVKYFFDGANVYTYTNNVPVGRYFIILSNAIASALTVPWHSQLSGSTPAMNLMQVASVRVTGL